MPFSTANFLVILGLTVLYGGWLMALPVVFHLLFPLWPRLHLVQWRFGIAVSGFLVMLIVLNGRLALAPVALLYGLLMGWWVYSRDDDDHRRRKRRRLLRRLTMGYSRRFTPNA